VDSVVIGIGKVLPAARPEDYPDAGPRRSLAGGDGSW
jgi:hypothetical protein